MTTPSQLPPDTRPPLAIAELNRERREALAGFALQGGAPQELVRDCILYAQERHEHETRDSAKRVPPTRPDVRRVGLGYSMAWRDAVVISVDRLRESRGELSGELTVLQDDEHIARGRLNLSSVAARRTMAAYLKERGGEQAWLSALERFCVGVLDGERQGPSVRMVGREPRRPVTPRCVAPWMPEGPSLLFAPGGAGKSTMAAGIAVTKQTGREVIPGWTTTEPGRVLVIDWEADEAEWNDNIGAIARGIDIEPPEIAYCRGERPFVDIVEFVAVEVSRRQIALLIVDSVGLALGTSRESADANESTLRLFAALRSVGVASLLVDHLRGDDMPAERAGTRPYGSVYKWNLARSVVELRRESDPGPEGAELLVLHRKLNDGPRMPSTGIRVAYSDDTIRFQRVAVLAPELEQHAGTTADRMARLLRLGAMTEAELAENLNVAPATVRSTLRRHPTRFRRLEGGRIGNAG